MVDQICSNFTEGGLSRFDTSTTSVTSEGASHASGVVGSEGLFVNWFEDGNIAFTVLDDVCSACTFDGKLGLKLLVETLYALSEAGLNLGVGGHGREEFNLTVSRFS
jgi:hypothetical protein